MRDGGADGAGGMRYRVLDSYRFVAALGIVIFHAQYDFSLGLGQFSRAFDKLFVMVDFFFVLSGFVIAQAYVVRVSTWRDYGVFLWKRLARIYPLHLATLILLVIAAETLDAFGRLGPRPDFLPWSALLQNLLLVQAWGTTADLTWNLPSWSISAEWGAYLVFPLMLWAVVRLPGWASALLVIACVGCVHGIREALGLYHWTNATYDGVMRAIPTFLAGVAISVGLSRAKSLPKVPWPLVHALFFLPLALLHFGAPEDAAVAIFPCVVALAAVAERTSKPSLLSASPFVRLGHASYALYLIHFPILFVATHVWPPASLPVWWRAAYAAGVALVATVLALSIHSWFEVPMQRWLTGLTFARRHPSRFRDHPRADWDGRAT